MLLKSFLRVFSSDIVMECLRDNVEDLLHILSFILVSLKVVEMRELVLC